MTEKAQRIVTWVLIAITAVILVRQESLRTEVKKAQLEAQRAQNQFQAGDPFPVQYMRRDVRAIMEKLDVPPPPGSPAPPPEFTPGSE